MEKEIIFGLTTIKYSVSYAERKTLRIEVSPEGTTSVKAPLNTSSSLIEEKIKKRAGWILKQQNYFKSLGVKTPKRRYISGESHFYLGKQYLLRVSEGKPNSVKYKGRYFEIICSPKSKAGGLMKEWYREHSKVKFAEIAEPIIHRFNKYNIEPASLNIQEMVTRWGSCTNKGKIILNTELIKAPRRCIEYVITHELCHLLHRRHSKEFYDLLSKEMPDWKRWKVKLEVFMY